MMKFEPFTRVIWNDDESRQMWRSKLHRMSKVFHDTEWRTFLRGYRDVYVAHVVPEDLEKYMADLAKVDYIYLPMLKSKKYSGFSHKHLPVQRGDEYFYYGVVARGKHRKKALQFKEASSSGDHITIGKLLGYPDCCTKFFQDIWGTVVDPMFEYSKETKDALLHSNELTVNLHPYCNQLLRYFGVRITSWFPCSGKCKNTIKIGDKWAKVMQDIDEQSYNDALQLLTEPLIWDCYRGIAIVKTKYFRGVTNSDFAPEKKIVINEGWYD
jgi:hypothetical protein